MPARASIHSPVDLASKAAQAEESLYSQFPHLAADIKPILAKITVQPPPVIIAEKKPMTTLSQEEIFSILQKIREVSQLPSTTLDQETLLYLEQQLADILGFEVSSEVDSHRLPFAKAVVAALPHQQFSPSSKEGILSYIPEAGFNRQRTYFGWDSSTAYEPEPSLNDDEDMFWISLPLVACSAQFSSRQEMKSWWKNRKMVVINPTEAIAVVVQTKDSFLHTANKYQYGASPAVIREGLFWSPLNAGRSLIFFVPDNDDQVDYGKYLLF